jgi:acetyl-CoA carboxylase biotin carboxyl carrier protein
VSRGDHRLLKFGEIRELIRLFDETSVVELNLELDDFKIRLKKPEAVQAAVAPSATGAAPVVGQAPATAPVAVSTPAMPTSVQATAAAVETQAPAPAATTAGGEDEAGIHIVTSPMVGTFYRAPAPDAPPFVERGTKVDEKTVVCIVEAMKLMNEIEAEVKGEVVDILAENGQLVEYGQPLFKIKLS